MKRLAAIVLALIALTGGRFYYDWQPVGAGSGGYNLVVEGPRGVTIAASDAGFIFRSTNRGASWTPIGRAQNALYTRPHTPAISFSYRSDSAIVLVASDGAVMRSVDDGLTFHATVFDTGSVTDWVTGLAHGMNATSVSNDTVYMAWHALTSDNDQGVVRRSLNSGITWAQVGAPGNPPAQLLRIQKIVRQPYAANIVYLLTGSDTFVDNSATTVNAHTLWRSLDGGTNWTLIAGPSVGGLAAADSVVDFMLHPYRPDTLFITTFAGDQRNNAHTGKVWICPETHEAASPAWTQLTTHTGTLTWSPLATDVTLYVCDTNRDSPGGETGMWKAATPFTSWSQINTGLNVDKGWTSFVKGAYGVGFRGWCNSITTSLLPHPAPIRFWRGTTQFVYSCDTTGGWVSAQTVKSPRPGPAIGTGKEFWRQTGVDGSVPMALAGAGPWFYAGYFDEGISRSNDGGLTWQKCNDSLLTANWLGAGGDCSTILADPSGNGRVWACQGSGKVSNEIIRSTAHGEPGSWAVDVGIPAAHLTGLSVDPLSPPGMRTLWVCANGDLYKSTDDGVNWSLIWDTTDSLRYTAVRGNEVWVGGLAFSAFKATDGGVNSASFTRLVNILPDWTPVETSSNFTQRYRGVRRIILRPYGEMFLVVGGEGTALGVYRSRNGGASFTNVHAGAHDRDFVIGPNGEWYVASASHTSSSGLQTGEGVVVSRDQGATWTAINSRGGPDTPNGLGISSINVGWLLVDPLYGEYLIAACPGQGLFRARLTGSRGYVP